MSQVYKEISDIIQIPLFNPVFFLISLLISLFKEGINIALYSVILVKQVWVTMVAWSVMSVIAGCINGQTVEKLHSQG